MKIGLIIKDFISTRGGGERYSVTLADQLVQKGHSVTVFARSFHTKNKEIEKVHVASKEITISKSLSFARKAEKKIQEKRAALDVVYGLTQAFSTDFLRLGGGLSIFWNQLKYKKRPWRKFFSLNHLFNKNLEKNMLHQKSLKKIVVNSDLCRSQLKEHYGINDDSIRLIRNGVDGEHFSLKKTMPLGDTQEISDLKSFAKNNLTLLFISNNYARKGLYEILSFMASEKCAKDLNLIIAGRGRTSHALRFCREKGLEKKVFFAGFNEDTRPLLALSDIFVLPTYYDPFANVCMEAGVFGLPVITTKQNGFSELIKNSCNGYVMDEPDDFESLKKGIETFGKRKSIESINEECRSTLLPFTPERNAEETIQMFEEC